MQAESDHAAFQRGRGETEDFRRPTRSPDAPLGEFQHPLDVFALDLRQGTKTRPLDTGTETMPSGSIRSVGPLAKIIARSMALRSSRTLPGQ